MSHFEVRTDLALEARENIAEKAQELRGVSIEEWHQKEIDVHVTKVIIETKMAQKKWGNRWEHTLHWRLRACWKQMTIIIVKYRRSLLRIWEM